MSPVDSREKICTTAIPCPYTNCQKSVCLHLFAFSRYIDFFLKDVLKKSEKNEVKCLQMQRTAPFTLCAFFHTHTQSIKMHYQTIFLGLN